MGNAKSLSGQKMGSRFLPEEQAEVDKLYDALSSSDGGVATGTFSLEALKARAITWWQEVVVVVVDLGSAVVASTKQLILVKGLCFWHGWLHDYVTATLLCPHRVKSSCEPCIKQHSYPVF